jgi:ribose transport system substrate-binding protein
VHLAKLFSCYKNRLYRNPKPENSTPMKGYFTLGLIVVFLGCGSNAPPEGASNSSSASSLAAAADKNKSIRIAVIPKSTGGEFWETVEQGAKQAGEALGVDILWEGPVSETEIAEQNKIIESMVNLGVQGLAVAPLNPKANQRSVQAAVDAGIPTVVFDSALDGNAHFSYIATNNFKGGVLGLEGLKSLLGDLNGKRLVLFRYIQGTASTEERCRGFVEGAIAGGAKIVADPYADDGQISGCKKTSVNTLESLIEDKRLQVDGIFCANLTSTLATAAALDDLRKSGVSIDVKFIGFDTSPKLIEELRAGNIDGLVAQDPRRMGGLAVETLVKHLRGEQVQSVVETPAVLVTKKNLAEDPAIQRLVGETASGLPK